MAKDLYTIKINYINETINQTLKDLRSKQVNFTRHFNHNEEFFIKIDSDFTVPQFGIHHDVMLDNPETEYLENITDIIKQLSFKLPKLFEGTMYFFNPSQILKPCFFEIYEFESTYYLFLLQIDLTFRPQKHRIIERGTNDITSSYYSNFLFIDSIFIPIKEIVQKNNKLHSFIIKSHLSDTWIGEKGDFYHKTGFWMDHTLTKFFSKLFFRENKKYYPYYPLICRYNTVCEFVFNFSREGRIKSLPPLHNAYKYLLPVLPEIQDDIKKRIEDNREQFKRIEDLAIYRNIKNNIPEELKTFADNINISMYLNDKGMREYKIDL